MCLLIVSKRPLRSGSKFSKKRTAWKILGKTIDFYGNGLLKLVVPCIVYAREFFFFHCVPIDYWKILQHCCFIKEKPKEFGFRQNLKQWVDCMNEVVHKNTLGQYIHEYISQKIKSKNLWNTKLRMKNDFT